MNILVTGGAGYIGSHAIVELLAHNHTVVIVDNLSNSSGEVMNRLAKITGKSIPLHVFDLQDKDRLEQLFHEESFDAVIHFAGLKAVGESVEKPLLYYRNNIDSTLALLEVMDKYNMRRLVFSSSATVYGSAPVPYTEKSPTGQGIINTYGQTKYMIEQILRDTAQANPANEFTILRYFNPVGAHESGLIGEQPNGTPNNLMPYITQVAIGKRDKLSVFGNDYDTVDGTGVRDYVHVVDLARGHVSALEHSRPGTVVYNLGTGHGVSVLQLVHAFEEAAGRKIPYQIEPRRSGDLPEYFADVQKAQDELGWKAEKTIGQACADSWRWQSANPNGYEG
jgi:UDP-glucose 4-epimerase